MVRKLISLRALIFDPSASEGQRVIVVGFADMTSERPALYPSEDAYRRKNPLEGIEIVPPAAAKGALEGMVVLAEGFFGKTPEGASGFSGNVGDLMRLEPWSDPAKAKEEPLATAVDLDDAIAAEMAGYVPLRRLLESPAEFDRKRIRVIGFAAMRFEQKGLFVSREAYQNRMSKEAIWVSTNIDPRLHERYVSVEGDFDMRSMGHMSMYSGTVAEPAACRIVEDLLVPRGSVGGKVESAAAKKDDDWAPPSSIPIPGRRRKP